MPVSQENELTYLPPGTPREPGNAIWSRHTLSSVGKAQCKERITHQDADKMWSGGLRGASTSTTRYHATNVPHADPAGSFSTASATPRSARAKTSLRGSGSTTFVRSLNKYSFHLPVRSTATTTASGGALFSSSARTRNATSVGVAAGGRAGAFPETTTATSTTTTSKAPRSFMFSALPYSGPPNLSKIVQRRDPSTPGGAVPSTTKTKSPTKTQKRSRSADAVRFGAVQRVVGGNEHVEAHQADDAPDEVMIVDNVAAGGPHLVKSGPQEFLISSGPHNFGGATTSTRTSPKRSVSASATRRFATSTGENGSLLGPPSFHLTKPTQSSIAKNSNIMYESIAVSPGQLQPPPGASPGLERQPSRSPASARGTSRNKVETAFNSSSSSKPVGLEHLSEKQIQEHAQELLRQLVEKHKLDPATLVNQLISSTNQSNASTAKKITSKPIPTASPTASSGGGGGPFMYYNSAPVVGNLQPKKINIACGKMPEHDHLVPPSAAAPGNNKVRLFTPQPRTILLATAATASSANKAASRIPVPSSINKANMNNTTTSTPSSTRMKMTPKQPPQAPPTRLIPPAPFGPKVRLLSQKSAFAASSSGQEPIAAETTKLSAKATHVMAPTTTTSSATQDEERVVEQGSSPLAKVLRGDDQHASAPAVQHPQKATPTTASPAATTTPSTTTKTKSSHVRRVAKRLGEAADIAWSSPEKEKPSIRKHSNARKDGPVVVTATSPDGRLVYPDMSSLSKTKLAGANYLRSRRSNSRINKGIGGQTFNRNIPHSSSNAASNKIENDNAAKAGAGPSFTTVQTSSTTSNTKWNADTKIRDSGLFEDRNWSKTSSGNEYSFDQLHAYTSSITSGSSGALLHMKEPKQPRIVRIASNNTAVAEPNTTPRVNSTGASKTIPISTPPLPSPPVLTGAAAPVSARSRSEVNEIPLLLVPTSTRRSVDAPSSAKETAAVVDHERHQVSACSVSSSSATSSKQSSSSSATSTSQSSSTSKVTSALHQSSQSSSKTSSSSSRTSQSSSSGTSKTSTTTSAATSSKRTVVDVPEQLDEQQEASFRLDTSCRDELITSADRVMEEEVLAYLRQEAGTGQEGQGPAGDCCTREEQVEVLDTAQAQVEASSPMLFYPAELLQQNVCSNAKIEHVANDANADNKEILFTTDDILAIAKSVAASPTTTTTGVPEGPEGHPEPAIANSSSNNTKEEHTFTMQDLVTLEQMSSDLAASQDEHEVLLAKAAELSGSESSCFVRVIPVEVASSNVTTRRGSMDPDVFTGARSRRTTEETIKVGNRSRATTTEDAALVLDHQQPLQHVVNGVVVTADEIRRELKTLTDRRRQELSTTSQADSEDHAGYVQLRRASDVGVVNISSSSSSATKGARTALSQQIQLPTSTGVPKRPVVFPGLGSASRRARSASDLGQQGAGLGGREASKTIGSALGSSSSSSKSGNPQDAKAVSSSSARPSTTATASRSASRQRSNHATGTRRQRSVTPGGSYPRRQTPPVGGGANNNNKRPTTQTQAQHIATSSSSRTQLLVPKTSDLFAARGRGQASSASASSSNSATPRGGSVGRKSYPKRGPQEPSSDELNKAVIATKQDVVVLKQSPAEADVVPTQQQEEAAYKNGVPAHTSETSVKPGEELQVDRQAVQNTEHQIEGSHAEAAPRRSAPRRGGPFLRAPVEVVANQTPFLEQNRFQQVGTDDIEHTGEGEQSQSEEAKSCRLDHPAHATDVTEESVKAEAEQDASSSATDLHTEQEASAEQVDDSIQPSYHDSSSHHDSSHQETVEQNKTSKNSSIIDANASCSSSASCSYSGSIDATSTSSNTATLSHSRTAVVSNSRVNISVSGFVPAVAEPSSFARTPISKTTMSLDRKMILPPTNSAVVMSSARRSTSSSTGTTGFGNIAGNIATEPRGVASVPLVASAPSYPSSSGSNMMLTTASSNSKTTTTRFVWPAAPVARPCLTPPQPLQLPNLVPLSARSSTISSAR